MYYTDDSDWPPRRNDFVYFYRARVPPPPRNLADLLVYSRRYRDEDYIVFNFRARRYEGVIVLAVICERGDRSDRSYFGPPRIRDTELFLVVNIVRY